MSPALLAPVPAAPVFAALGDPTRLRLLGRLAGADGLSIAELSRDSGMTRQGVTKHLQVLARAGLVRDRSEGRERVYQMDATPLREVDAWIAQYRAAWAERFERLDDYLLTLKPKDPPRE